MMRRRYTARPQMNGNPICPRNSFPDAALHSELSAGAGAESLELRGHDHSIRRSAGAAARSDACAYSPLADAPALASDRPRLTGPFRRPVLIRAICSQKIPWSVIPCIPWSIGSASYPVGVSALSVSVFSFPLTEFFATECTRLHGVPASIPDGSP